MRYRWVIILSKALVSDTNASLNYDPVLGLSNILSRLSAAASQTPLVVSISRLAHHDLLKPIRGADYFTFWISVHILTDNILMLIPLLQRLKIYSAYTPKSSALLTATREAMKENY